MYTCTCLTGEQILFLKRRLSKTPRTIKVIFLQLCTYILELPNFVNHTFLLDTKLIKDLFCNLFSSST